MLKFKKGGMSCPVTEESSFIEYLKNVIFFAPVIEFLNINHTLLNDLMI